MLLALIGIATNFLPQSNKVFFYADLFFPADNRIRIFGGADYPIQLDWLNNAVAHKVSLVIDLIDDMSEGRAKEEKE